MPRRHRLGGDHHPSTSTAPGTTSGSISDRTDSVVGHCLLSYVCSAREAVDVQRSLSDPVYGVPGTRNVEVELGSARCLEGVACRVNCEEVHFGLPLSSLVIEQFLAGAMPSCPVCHRELDPWKSLTRLPASDPSITGLAGARRTYASIDAGPGSGDVHIADLLPPGARLLDLHYEPGVNNAAINEWGRRHPELFPPGGGEVHVPDEIMVSDPPPWLERPEADSVLAEDSPATRQRHEYAQSPPGSIVVHFDQVASVELDFVWFPDDAPPPPWRYLRTASEQLRRGENNSALVLANASVEAALGPVVRVFLDDVAGKDAVSDFMNKASYGPRLKVLLPLICRERELRVLPDPVKEALHRLQYLRNRVAHGEGKEPDQEESVRLFVGAVFGVHYLELIGRGGLQLAT